jgi:hypothetical protein
MAPSLKSKAKIKIDSFLLRTRLKVFAVVLMLLLGGSSGHPQVSRSPRVPTLVYGTWEIYKFVEVGGHAGEIKEHAQSQIGKTMKIGGQSFEHDDDTLWFGRTPCKTARYRIEVHRIGPEYEVDPGALSFHDLDRPESDRDEFVVVSCAKRELCFLEFAKNQDLAVYYDGWFFFLRKKATN